MQNFVRICSLAATLCLGIPATGLSNDHDHGHGGGGGGGNWNHGGNYYHGGSYYHGGHYYYGSHAHFYGGYFPFYAAYPYYSTPYYDSGYYDGYADGPAPAETYRGARVEDDRGDSLPLDVQRALRREGYYHGGIDGDVGAGTRAAIRQYQYDHSLEVTGRIDRSLIRSLGLD